MKEDDITDAEIIDEPHQQQQHSANNNTDNSHQADDLKTRLLSAEHWLRFLFMALFVIIAFAASYVVLLLIIVQFVFALFSGNSDEKLRVFGASLSKYLFQILSFLTYNSEQKPYPFADWPEVDSEESGQDNLNIGSNI